MERKIDESVQRMEGQEKIFNMMEKHMFTLSKSIGRIKSNQSREKPHGKSNASSSEPPTYSGTGFKN